MKTDRLPTQKLHNEEWFELQSECKEGIELFDPEEIGIKYLYDGYAPLTVKADKALKVLQKSSYTHEMEETDKKRGEVCVGFFGTVRSAAKQLDPNKQKAALHLYNLVEGYRNSIVNGTYTEETAAIYNMLQDLRGPYAADITLLGFANWVDDIDQADRLFRQAYSERRKEDIAKPKEKLRKIRAEVDTHYVAMMNAIDGILLSKGLGGDIVLDTDDTDEGGGNEGGGGPVEESAPVTHEAGSQNATYRFTVYWNDTLKKYRNLLLQRAGRKARHKNEEENDDEDLGPVEE